MRPAANAGSVRQWYAKAQSLGAADKSGLNMRTRQAASERQKPYSLITRGFSLCRNHRQQYIGRMRRIEMHGGRADRKSVV